MICSLKLEHARFPIHQTCAHTPPQSKNPRRLMATGVFWCNSLTMTYFHTGCSTIIGAKSFHGPVRDGKGWYQLAMVIRHDLSILWRAALLGALPAHQTTQTGRSSINYAEFGIAGCEYQIVVHHTQRACNRQGYRDKPLGQLVLVSLMHYCTSTPSLSTSWSRTTL